MRRKLARIHLCRHFQQQTNYLYVYYKFSPCFWGPTSHHWPSPDGKGKKDVGRKKRIKIVRLITWLIFHSYEQTYTYYFSYFWFEIANSSHCNQRGWPWRGWHFRNSTTSKMTLWGDRLFFYRVKIKFTKILFQNSLKINGFFTLLYTAFKS